MRLFLLLILCALGAATLSSQPSVVTINAYGGMVRECPSGDIVFAANPLQASGGTPPYHWSVTTPATMPPDVTLNTDGSFSSPATDWMTPDIYTFSVTVVDAAFQQGTGTITMQIGNIDSGCGGSGGTGDVTPGGGGGCSGALYGPWPAALVLLLTAWAALRIIRARPARPRHSTT
jgi:hypothetical protein